MMGWATSFLRGANYANSLRHRARKSECKTVFILVVTVLTRMVWQLPLPIIMMLPFTHHPVLTCTVLRLAILYSIVQFGLSYPLDTPTQCCSLEYQDFHTQPLGARPQAIQMFLACSAQTTAPLNPAIIPVIFLNCLIPSLVASKAWYWTTSALALPSIMQGNSVWCTSSIFLPSCCVPWSGEHLTPWWSWGKSRCGTSWQHMGYTWQTVSGRPSDELSVAFRSSVLRWRRHLLWGSSIYKPRVHPSSLSHDVVG